MKKNESNIKKFSDYIMTFAFLYSSFVCFSTAAEKWQNQKLVAIIILVCGLFSFVAVFRGQIAGLIYKIKKKNSNG